MDEIKILQELDIIQIVIGVFIIISAIISIATVVSKFADYIGRPIKWIKKNDKDHELLLNTIAELQELRKQELEDKQQSIKHDQAIRTELEKLTKLVVEKEIDDTRWEILNFCSNLANGQTYNREAFEHVFRLYEKYERILKENNMTNGYVEESMKYAREAFHKILP
jgi:hypothetical protein